MVDKIHKKQVRLGVHWGNDWIDQCVVGFTKDNSFVFIPKQQSKGGEMEFGLSNLRNGVFGNHQMTHQYNISQGCHISLHPKKQVMHFRESYPGEIIFERKIEWFPVNQAFNLLHYFSPPLDKCNKSLKQPTFFTPIATNYQASLHIKVDIFPRGAREHYPQGNSLWIYWGYCPGYLARVSFNLINQRVKAIVYWPDDSKLTL